MFENYKDSQFNDKIILKSQQKFKTDCHEVYAEEINKITLSSNDHKTLQRFGKITTYPFGTNSFKVCESEMIIMRDVLVKNYENCPFYDEIILQQRQ